MREYRILIVEDVGMIADFMGLILSHHGYRISGVVASGEEAVAAALRTCPDLVLMDIKIEGVMDGIAAAELIREQCDVPIIYVTAHTEKAVIDRAMLTEPAACLHKPFKGNELLGAIRKTLESPKGRKVGAMNRLPVVQ
ncbi:MAG: response regulator [Geobacteraceae bacterium]|nr:response regulator [Geobacteraceae bacterium]